MDISIPHMIILLVVWISQTGSSFVLANDSSQQYVPCKQGWFLYGEKCYKMFGLSKGLSWNQAKVNCSLERGHLVSIDSEELQAFLTMFLVLNEKTNAWIGLHDQGQQLNFTWDDGSIVNYTNWDRNEPSNIYHQQLEDCVEMRFIGFKNAVGTWNDESCQKEQPYICQMDKDETTRSADPRFCSVEEGGGWKHQNSCYHIVTEEKSWQDAEKYCEENFGGYLVTVLDDKADMFLNYLSSNLTKDFWIGIKMRDQLVQKWASGWHVIYSEWDHALVHFLNGTCGLKKMDKTWTVGPCFRELLFICEKLKYNIPVLKKPPSDDWQCPNSSKNWLDLEGESCYLIEANTSIKWFEALYECSRQGGVLATLHSEEETNILHRFLLNKQERMFIGFHRNKNNKNIFEWVDGSELNYQNWNIGEPNSQREECGEIWTATMKWNDVPCDVSKGYICSAKKVPPLIEQKSKSMPSDCACQLSSNEADVTVVSNTCSSGITAKTVFGIIIGIQLIIFLIGAAIYYSRHFCTRHFQNILPYSYTSSSEPSLHNISSEIILKPVHYDD